MARPGGNVTGFTAFEYAIGGKWLSLLKEFSPKVERVALLFSVRTEPWAENFWRAFEASAPQYGIKPIRMDVRDAAELERSVEALAREPNAGLIGVPAITLTQHRELVIRMLAQHRLPAIYPVPLFSGARRAGLLRHRRQRHVATLGDLRRPHLEGSQPGRPARTGAD